MSLMRSLGRLSGKMGSNKELIAGMMEGLDARAIADAINENAGFMTEVMSHLDPKAIADSMNDGLGFMGDVLKYMDPSKVAEVVNKNERILPRYIECINPNVFTRSAGTVLTKLRYATYRPPVFGKPEEVAAEG